MSRSIYGDITELIETRKTQGLYKTERIITSPQGAEIEVGARGKVLNFCANNYLGLSSHPEVCRAAREAMDSRGYGLSSVRFICGTQDLHKELEEKMSEFLGTDDTILYAACYDANAGVFEPFLDQDSAIIADQLNHASIISGVRLCKAERYIYSHNQTGTGTYSFDGKDLPGLEAILRSEEVQSARYRMVATDGVFSMNGDIAPLDKIADLCDRYDAILMVDDSHGTGWCTPIAKIDKPAETIVFGDSEDRDARNPQPSYANRYLFVAGASLCIPVLRINLQPSPVIVPGRAAVVGRLSGTESEVIFDLLRKVIGVSHDQGFAFPHEKEIFV